MKFDFFDRRSAERFAELLDDQPTIRRHAAGDLAELVAISHTLSAAPPKVHVDPEFRTGLRAMLLATAERDGIGVTAVSDEPGAHAGVREPRPGLLGTGSARRIRVRGAIVISVAAGAMAVSGISAASEGASPGDTLYGLKISTERAQLAMAGSDLTRGELFLDFARNRLTEAAAMAGVDPTFAGVLDDMDANTRQGVKLLNGSAVARRDPATLKSVDVFVAGQRDTLNAVLAKLSPDNRERAQGSLDLLDAVSQRADDLRAGLSCPEIDPVEADPLGPILAGCAVGKGSTGTTEHAQPSGEKPGSKPADPVTQPGGADQAVPGVSPVVPSVTPSSSAPVPVPSDAPDGGVLEGILGGILGG